MTNLKKALKRTVVLGGRVDLVIELNPNGTLRFREKRRRKTYDLPIMAAYRFAVEADAAKARADKKKSRGIKLRGRR